MKLSSTPYISFVVTSRNDNHGGDMTKRMRIFVNGLIAQCNAHKLNAELVFVEWNPEPDKPYLSEVLPSPQTGDYLSIRYIRVPHSIHKTLKFSEHLPIYQMIAKNVGIRRAAAPYVLCTNVDLLFSDALMKLLAARVLKKNHFYRANRCDIPNTIDQEADVSAQLRFAASHTTKRLGFVRAGRFDTRLVALYDRVIHHFYVPLVGLLRRDSHFKEKVMLGALDYDACGDFTLMSKEDWLDIDGYVELEMYSLHIDSMGLMSAFAKAKKQVIFPPEACSYHIAHQGGWEIDDPIEKLKFFSKLPTLEWWSVWQSGLKILLEKSNFNINSPDWGLRQHQLEEVTQNSWKTR
ncbi:MAG: hypothetical protein CL867_06455 [Cytophagaceae bacterium]|nr:hypothetical protein [Cytophagaceae bacterium]